MSGKRRSRLKKPGPGGRLVRIATEQLEQELQTELNETRVSQSAGDHAKIGVVGGATRPVGITELRVVE